MGVFQIGGGGRVEISSTAAAVAVYLICSAYQQSD